MMRFLLFLSILAFTACRNENLPAGTLEHVRMQKIMWDLFRADELLNHYATLDSGYNRAAAGDSLYQRVYLLHGTTKDQFKKSYQYYQQHPEHMKKLVDSLQAFAARRVPTPPAY